MIKKYLSLSLSSLSHFSSQSKSQNQTLEASASFRATCNFDSEIFSSQYKSFSALRRKEKEEKKVVNNEIITIIHFLTYIHLYWNNHHHQPNKTNQQINKIKSFKNLNRAQRVSVSVFISTKIWLDSFLYFVTYFWDEINQ